MGEHTNTSCGLVVVVICWLCWCVTMMEISVPRNKKVLDARLLPFFWSYLSLALLCSVALTLWDRYSFPILPTTWSDRTCFTVSVFVVHESLFFCNVIYLLFDHYHILPQYKIERPKSAGSQPSKELVIKSLKKQLFSHIFVQIPSLYYLLFPLFSHFGSSWNISESHSFFRNVVLLCFTALVNDLMFYSFHVMLHHRWFYKRIHAQHHEYKASTGFAAEYAHPVESLLGNQLPTIMVPLLAGMNFQLLLMWIFCRLVRTHVTHSGYKIPLLMPGNAIHHDIHHTSNIGNLGGTPLFDCVFGT